MLPQVPVPWEHSSDTVSLQYMLHKVTSQNFTKFHHLPHPHPHSTPTTTVITCTIKCLRMTLPLPTTPPQYNHTCGMKFFPFASYTNYYYRSSVCTPIPTYSLIPPTTCMFFFCLLTIITSPAWAAAPHTPRSPATTAITTC